MTHQSDTSYLCIYRCYKVSHPGLHHTRIQSLIQGMPFCFKFPSDHAPRMEQPTSILQGPSSSMLPNQSTTMLWLAQITSPMSRLWLAPIRAGVSHWVGTQDLPPCQTIGPRVFPHGYSLFIFANFLFCVLCPLTSRMLPQGCVDPQAGTEGGQTIATWLPFTLTNINVNLKTTWLP